jgi:hypothetical protein
MGAIPMAMFSPTHCVYVSVDLFAGCAMAIMNEGCFPWIQRGFEMLCTTRQVKAGTQLPTC